MARKKKKLKLNQKLNKKEKREIGMMFISVALVGLTALFLGFNAPEQAQVTNFHGAASGLSADYPTYSGMLNLLEKMCYWKDSSGDNCNDVCESFDHICIPLEGTCSEGLAKQCRCCDYPK